MTASSRKYSPPSRFRDRLAIAGLLLPTGRLVLLALPGCLLALLSGAFPAAASLFWLYNGLLVLLSVIDMLLLPRRDEWTLERELPDRIDVQEPLEIRLRLRSRQAHRLRIELRDDLPLPFEGALQDRTDGGQEESGRPSAGGRGAESGELPESGTAIIGVYDGRTAEFVYKTRALERGSYDFRFVDVRYSGGLGLWSKQLRLQLPSRIRVYPNLSGVRSVLGSLQQTLILEGSRVHRREWGGSEFDSVRDYVQGDELRRINWQATARSAKPMTNRFHPEKGKTITLLIDCGRLMGVELDGRVKLDRTLEAALTVAAVALRQGDGVALLAFSSGVKLYVPPGRGSGHLRTLTEAVYDLRPDAVETRYSAAIVHLLRVLRRRSLLLLFSEMESYLYDEELRAQIGRLRRGHPLLMLSLNDPLLHQWSRIVPGDSRTAYIQSTAHKFSLDRASYVQEMAGLGVPVMDVPVGRLALSAVRAYLELKAREAW